MLKNIPIQNFYATLTWIAEYLDITFFGIRNKKTLLFNILI